MKRHILFLVSLLSLMVATMSAQEKSKKELRKEQKKQLKIEKEKRTAVLIDNKTFVFVADKALPTGRRSIDLTGDGYLVEFQPEFIDSYLPFFGKAYSGVGYGGGNGLKFKGEPKSFNAKKTKKNYQIDVVVKEKNDTYNLMLTVGFQGGASLSISSNNRTNISYQGEIRAPEPEAAKE